MSTSNATSRRRFLRTSLDAGLLAILATTFAGRALGADAKPGAGSISMLKGQVFVNGKAATQKTTIPVNAEVRTGKRSMVAFTVGGDAHVLKSNTLVTMNSSGGFTDQLRLLAGSLLSAWGQRPPGKYAMLSTATATIGIRGTVTFCTVGRFSLLQGSVEYGYTDARGVKKIVTLARDAKGKAVSIDEHGTIIDWVPPISKEEAAALKQAITNAISEGSASPGGNTEETLETLSELLGITGELEQRTLSGELVVDVPPEGGNASPQ